MAQVSDENMTDASPLQDPPIVDAAGRAVILISAGQGNADDQAWLRLANGMEVLVPVGLLTPHADGVCRLPFAFDISPQQSDQMRLVFPLIEETLQAGKRMIDTGRGVRVRKTVVERTQPVEQTLLRDELTIERVPVGQPLAADEMPQTRYEGETLVVPVLEEVLVVQKQLRLKEEVRITRHQRPVQVRQEATLRAEQAAVERFDEGGGQA